LNSKKKGIHDLNIETAISEIEANLTGNAFQRVVYETESFSWKIDLQNGTKISFSGIWRLFEEGDLCATSFDHGKYFGERKAFDGVKAISEMVGVRINKCRIEEKASDIYIEFENKFAIEFLMTSAGYEGWEITFENGKYFIGRGYEVISM
jgi:hypothetical protein